MQLIVLSVLVAVAAASYGYGNKGYGSNIGRGAGGGSYSHGGSIDYYAKPDYSYGYATSDPYSGVENTAQENRNGYQTEGSYSTLLPDGRKQVVTYWVDGDSGFNADVKYYGVAQHPKTAVKSSGYGHGAVGGSVRAGGAGFGAAGGGGGYGGNAGYGRQGPFHGNQRYYGYQAPFFGNQRFGSHGSYYGHQGYGLQGNRYGPH